MWKNILNHNEQKMKYNLNLNETETIPKPNYDPNTIKTLQFQSNTSNFKIRRSKNYTKTKKNLQSKNFNRT